MKRMYKVEIAREVDVIKDGLMSFGKKHKQLTHPMTLTMWENSVVDIHEKIRTEHNGYNIISIDKL